MILGILFVGACICSFLVGMHINIKHAEYINKQNIRPFEKICYDKFEHKQVSDVDGYVWRNVCKYCSKTSV